MRYVAAALLLQLSEQEVTAEAIGKILGSVGVETDKKNLEENGTYEIILTREERNIESCNIKKNCS